MALSDTTQAIRDNLAGAETGYYRAGKLLVDVNETKSFKEGGFRSFHAYLNGPLADIDHGWAYELMDVVTHFTEQQAASYGVSSLEQLCRIQEAIFPALKPTDLLTGTHAFTDADGAEHVLDFQKDHTVKTLKAFLGAHRLPHPPAKLQSNEAKAYDKILRREKADLPIFAYQISEQLHDRETFLKIVLQGPAGVFDDVFSDLSGDDD